ncbi:hypothetical protein [Pragia fontium]|uniref:hypothetical protein n=1 Tax=Pragia fontium TaxID=82985 RepID=UPI00064A67C4|nr:hypothetical protein [Pragia fontium]AKJ41776.1 hypothetical protein QQ39_06500 [Pragia fontium]
MLSKFRLLTYEISESNYKEYDTLNQQGTYDYTISKPEPLAIDEPSSESPMIISLKSKIGVIGYTKTEEGKEESKEKAFEIFQEITLYFGVEPLDDPEDFDLNDLCETHEWFFSNFMSIAAKSCIETSLKHTDFRSIALPLWRQPYS